MLAGTYAHGAVIKGVCFVDGGIAVVQGNLTLTAGSALVGGFALNDVTGPGSSSLTVFGDVRVGRGASLFLGCEPGHFTCFDDTNNPPTLSSVGIVRGSIIEDHPLGVVVHNSWIGGSVTELGGGGGVNCTPVGIWAVPPPSPVYSDYEDSTIRGNLHVSGLQTCWLGIARVLVGGDVTVDNNTLLDPDGVEIISNNIRGDLSCHGNVTPANAAKVGNHGVWDSADPTGKLFPRLPLPNKVQGDRMGNCRLASPTTPGGPLGPGAF